MNDESVAHVHWSFWLVGAFALIWHVLGSANYLMQLNPEWVETLPDTHRAIIHGRPAWATAGFAIAVFGGALASLLLLFRRRVALYLFGASLVGALATTIHTAGVAGSVIRFTGMEMFMMILSPILMAGLLIAYAVWVGRKGWVS